MKPTVRPATSHDLETILKLNQDLFSFEKQFNQTYNHDWTYSPKGMEYFRKRIEEGIVLVSELNHQIVGYLCGYAGHYSHRSINPIFEIENMAVSADFRRQGCGTELVKTLFETLKEKEIFQVKVGAIFGNENAISFYKKLGLIEYELFLEKSL